MNMEKINNYRWFVHTDNIVGIEKVLEVNNVIYDNRNEILMATVLTESNYSVNRMVKIIDSGQQMERDFYIYAIKKDGE